MLTKRRRSIVGSTMHCMVPNACILDLSCAGEKAMLFAFQNQSVDKQQVLKS